MRFFHIFGQLPRDLYAYWYHNRLELCIRIIYLNLEAFAMEHKKLKEVLALTW